MYICVYIYIYVYTRLHVSTPYWQILIKLGF